MNRMVEKSVPEEKGKQTSLSKEDATPIKMEDWNWIQDHANDVLPNSVPDEKPAPASTKNQGKVPVDWVTKKYG